MSWSVVRPASRFPSLGSEKGSLMLAANSLCHTWILPMRSTQGDLFEESSPVSPSGKTCPASSVTETTPSAAFWERLPAKMGQSSRQGSDGRTLVVCLDPKEQSRGGSLMPNISEWPNDAAVCSLSQVLVKGSIPQRYFLSRKACAGILRRAEARGKRLPDLLRRALTFLVQPVAFSAKDYGGDAMENLSPTLRAGGHHSSHANAGIMPAIAFPANLSGTQCASTEGLSPSMGAKNPTAVASGLSVRRLMPVECERLQGMPRGHTDIPYRNKKAADGPRYKAIGNSKAVPCVRWLGERIAAACKA